MKSITSTGKNRNVITVSTQEEFDIALKMANDRNIIFICDGEAVSISDICEASVIAVASSAEVFVYGATRVYAMNGKTSIHLYDSAACVSLGGRIDAHDQSTVMTVCNLHHVTVIAKDKSVVITSGENKSTVEIEDEAKIINMNDSIVKDMRIGSVI